MKTTLLPSSLESILLNSEIWVEGREQAIICNDILSLHRPLSKAD